MPGKLDGKRVAFLAADGVEQVELTEPWQAVEREGGTPELIFLEEVAAICHGPWTLVEADVVRGRTLTSFPSIRTDVRNAGGNWVDQEVVVDSGLVTSRNPDDLPAFCRKLVEEIGEGEHAGQARSTTAAAS